MVLVWVLGGFVGFEICGEVVKLFIVTSRC